MTPAWVLNYQWGWGKGGSGIMEMSIIHWSELLNLCIQVWAPVTETVTSFFFFLLSKLLLYVQRGSKLREDPTYSIVHTSSCNKEQTNWSDIEHKCDGIVLNIRWMQLWKQEPSSPSDSHHCLMGYLPWHAWYGQSTSCVSENTPCGRRDRQRESRPK